MAYGVTNPPNNWSKEGALTENKVAHSSFGATALTNHGTHCRRIGSTSGGTRYTLLDASTTYARNLSMRIAFGQWTTSTMMRVLLFSRMKTSTRFEHLNHYTVGLHSGSTNTVYINGNQAINATHYNPSSYAISITLPFTISIGNWYAMRFDTLTDGDDVRLMLYFLQGYQEVDKMFTNPNWHKVYDGTHRYGFATPYTRTITGITAATSSNAFTEDDPSYIGQCGFVVTAAGNSVSPARYVHVDSLQILTNPKDF